MIRWRPRTRSSRRRLLLVGLEVGLACAADGAEPVVRDGLEWSPRRDAPVWIALLGVVHEPARGADPELRGLGLGRHRSRGYRDPPNGLNTSSQTRSPRFVT